MILDILHFRKYFCYRAEDPAVGQGPGTTQASQDVGNGKSVGLSDVFHSKSWQTTVPQPQYQNQNIFSSQADSGE